MSNKHYDIAIIGGSVTACITATLLAKSGSKVLFVRDRETRAPAWFHSSLFLEKLLGVTGGRSCFIAPQPIQVLAERSRVTITHNGAFDEELVREFGADAPELQQWLMSLQQVGQQLEELFWENGGLPWPTLKASARFKLLCMKHKINLNQLQTPVPEHINNLPGSTRDFVIDLLQGLSARTIDNLPYARAAMLWAQALRPENLKEPEFSDTLAKRFDQFHGNRASLEELEGIRHGGSQWTGGRFKSGAEFTAKTFLLGNRRCLKMFSTTENTLKHAVYSPRALKTTDLKGQLSPLIEHRMICGGKFPVRIALEEEEEQLRGLVLTAPNVSEDEVRTQLDPVLPFAKYKLEDANTSHAATTDPARQAMSLPFTSLPLRIKGNLYNADRTGVLPEMGAAGAALMAWTLHSHLSGNLIKL